MRLNIKEAIRVAKHNKKKKRYVEKRQSMLAAYTKVWGNPMDWTTEQVKEFDQRRKELHDKEMGDDRK